MKLLGVLTVLCCLGRIERVFAENRLPFKTEATGLEIAVTDEILALRVTPKNWSVETFSAKSSTDAKTAAIQSNAIAAINANFFDVQNKPLGIVISQGKTLQKIHKGGRVLTGIFAITTHGPEIFQRERFIPDTNIREAIQAGPRLIETGIPLKLASQTLGTRRSAIGIDAKGRVVILASKSRFPGLSFAALQELLLGLEIREALNLDGGGSSQLFVQKTATIPEQYVTGGDTVPVFLIVKSR